MWPCSETHLGWILFIVLLIGLSTGAVWWAQMGRYSKRLKMFDEWQKKQTDDRIRDLKDLTAHREQIALILKQEHEKMTADLLKGFDALVVGFRMELHALQQRRKDET